MTLIFVALGAFLLGAGAVGWCAHHFLTVGFQLGRDDRVLDPGPVVGSLPSAAPPAAAVPVDEPSVWTAPEDVEPVGQSSGPRHARTEWPTTEPVDEPTEQMKAVTR